MSRFPVDPLLLLSPLILLLCGSPTRLHAEPLFKLPAPENVKIHSYNLNQVLSWDPVPVKTGMGKVTYEVEYQPYTQVEWSEGWQEIEADLSEKLGVQWYGDKDWNKTKCSKITETKCDFTDAFDISWRVYLRVQAVNDQLESDWVNTMDFQATRDTIVGPPTSVKLSSDYGLLTVTFSPPFKKVSELRYYVCYWKDNGEKKVKSTRSTSIALHDLDPWTEYCVQMFTEYITGERNGTLSEAVCNKTTATAVAIATFTAKILFPAIFVLFCLVVGCVILKQKFFEDIKRWISPPFRIPPHIEEYLNDPKDHIFLANVGECRCDEDHYDTLSIVSSK